MVIQHNRAIQKKYLPIIRDAVKTGRAETRHLAMLEDRIAIEEGRAQIYGSQLQGNALIGGFDFLPIIDPDNLDQRRAQVGLGSYADYVSEVGLVWDLATFKKRLPELERQLKYPADQRR